jgi:hypothetical protein
VPGKKQARRGEIGNGNALAGTYASGGDTSRMKEEAMITRAVISEASSSLLSGELLLSLISSSSVRDRMNAIG